MNFIKSKKGIATLAALLIVAISAVGAYAYWTQGGTGSGTAATGTTTGITVNQTTSPTGMYPGSTPQSLAGDFTNTNTSAVTISSVTAVVSSVSGAGTDTSKPDCTTADYAIAGSAAGSVVPVGTHVGTWTGLTIQLVDGAGNQDNCKNAVAHVTYTANA